MSKIKNALISVSDKEGLRSVLQALKKNKINVISSGGTYKSIKKLGFGCKEVSQFTEFEEMLDGRVKTLHPKIFGGILSKKNSENHNIDLKKFNINKIDMVICNLYKFEKVINSNEFSNEDAIENIDIGGASILRAAAKNYNDVVVITSSNQYPELIDQLKKYKGSTSLEFRKKMSSLAFTETAYYDSLISEYFNYSLNKHFPQKKIIYGNLIEQLRYGENPHQKSAIYSKNTKLDIKQIHGKPLSYNNYNDIFSALIISKSLPKNTGTVIVKHANPSGVSALKNNIESYKAALACDPISAFGGIVSCNFKITKNLAVELNKIFLEVIIANSFDKGALKILKLKKNLRLIDGSNLSQNEILKFNSINNSMIVQTEDNKIFSKNNFKVVSRKKPSKSQFNNLIFAFNICRYVKSNAIVLASNYSTIGIGSGQPSRLDSCEIAINKMNKFSKTKNEIVAASDAFFPFVDGIEKLVQSGASAVIQPSGSIRDKEIIKFANATDTVLVFSKTRHFRH